MTGYRDLAFGELTRGAIGVELPLCFRLPAGFVAVSDDSGLQTWWMGEEDRAARQRDAGLAPRNGFFSVTLSMNVGYDRGRDVFFGGGDRDGNETTMAADFARAGVRDVVVERYDVNGIPTLFVDGWQGDRRIAMSYLATLIDTNVVYLFYSHPTPFRDLDRQRWEEMKRAVLASGPVVRIAR